MNIQQRFEEKGILFPIVQKPVFVSEQADTIDDLVFSDTGYTGIFKEGECVPLYIGKRYKPIHNSELIPIAERMEDNGYKFQSVDNYQDSVFRFKFVRIELKFNVFQEPAYLKFDMFNSYNGQHALELRAGIYIQTCSNGATSLKSQFRFYARHTGNMLKNLDRLPEKADNFKNLLENISWEDGNTQLFADEVIKNTKLSNKSKEVLIDRYNHEYQIYRNIKFSYFMAGTYLTTHNGLPYTQKLQLEKEVDYWVLN